MSGQEEQVDSDELYALSEPPPERFRPASGVREQSWHFMDEQTREVFLLTWLPDADFIDYHDLLADFATAATASSVISSAISMMIIRPGGKTIRESDSEAFTTMMRAWRAGRFLRPAGDGRECRELMDRNREAGYCRAYVVTGKAQSAVGAADRSEWKNVLSKAHHAE